jgi:hypothetical protein
MNAMLFVLVLGAVAIAAAVYAGMQEAVTGTR